MVMPVMIPPPSAIGYVASPAGQHSEGHRFGNKKRFADIFDTPYFMYRPKTIPGPGAGNFALETLSLPEIAPVGRATCVRKPFRPLQGAQVYISGQALLTAGIGGLAAGTLALVPLVDSYSGDLG